MKDYYAILGLDSDASAESIKMAYRRLARENHPDKIGSLDAEMQKQASVRMADLNEAYAVLSDRRQRRDYDAQYIIHIAPPPEPAEGEEPAAAQPVAPVVRTRAKPGADVLSSGVRQFGQQVRKELQNLKAFTWKEQPFEGFDWAMTSSFFLEQYWVTLRGFPTADRAAADKYTNYANLAIEKYKSWFRSNFFLFLLPFQRISDAEGVVTRCQRFAQAAGESAFPRSQVAVVLFDAARGQSRLCGARIQDKRFVQLLQTLRLSKT